MLVGAVHAVIDPLRLQPTTPPLRLITARSSPLTSRRIPWPGSHRLPHQPLSTPRCVRSGPPRTVGLGPVRIGILLAPRPAVDGRHVSLHQCGVHQRPFLQDQSPLVQLGLQLLEQGLAYPKLFQCRPKAADRRSRAYRPEDPAPRSAGRISGPAPPPWGSEIPLLQRNTLTIISGG